MPTLHLESVIFDLDGVLIDSEPLQQQAYIEVLSDRGLAVSREDLLRLVGRREREILGELLAGTKHEEKLAEVMAARHARYLMLLQRDVQPMPGARAAVQAMRELSLRCALATSSGRDEVAVALDRIGISSRFDVVITGEDVRTGKPDPETYTVTVRALASAPDRCIAIEDSEPGVRSALAAGVRTVVVPNPLTRSAPIPAAALMCESLDSAVSTIKWITASN